MEGNLSNGLSVNEYLLKIEQWFQKDHSASTERVRTVAATLRGTDYDLFVYLEQSFGAQSDEIIRRSLRHMRQFVTDDKEDMQEFFNALE